MVGIWRDVYQFLRMNGVDMLGAAALGGFDARFSCFWFVFFLDLIERLTDSRSHRTAVGAGANAGGHL